MSLEKVDLAHFPLTGVSLIEASAGTGKTYAISHLYLRYLLETDYEVGQILVVTFTNAATQELKGRIRDLIYQVRAFLQGAEAEDEQMKRLFSRYRGEQTALEKLQTAIINFDEASIYSIHGFCQRVLTRFPVETGALLQQQLVPDEKALLRSSIHDYWRNKIIALEVVQLHWILNQWRHPDDLLKDVLPVMYQLDDIADMKLLDGESVRYEIEQVWGQLKKAWQDSSEMIKEVLLNNPALRKNSYKPQTIQNLLKELALIFQHPLPYELPKKWNLLSTEKLRASLLKNQNDERIEFPFFRYARDFENLHTHWLRQQRILLLVETAKEVQSQVAVLKTRSLNRSFDDLITDLSEALRYRDQYLVDKITREYPVALVDEFQDTDNRQYFIFSTLYRNQAAKSLVLIGDPKQAIYRFRGADVFTYQRARQDTHDHFTLGINYRSSEAYIDVINRLFANNPDAFVLDQLIRFNPVDFDPHTTRIITLSDEPVEPLVAWLHPFNKKPISKTQAAHYFANCCAEEIQKLLAQAELKIDGKSIQARDLAVLVKTGRQATMIKQQLSRRGIGSALVLRDSVFDSPQADDISRLLEVLVDPTDIPTLAGLLSTDIFSWNALQIEQMQQDNETLVDLLEQFKQYQKHSQEKGILSMFFLILQQHNTVQMNYGHMDGERRLTNWLHIVELLQQQSVQHTSLSQSLTWLNQQRQDMQANGDNEEHQLRLESDSNLVRIVTIHKSKGLEYPIVFLPFMWDVKSAINQPGTYTVHDDAGNKKLQLYDEALRERWHEENLAEEVRLFYVAMTRARYRCYVGMGHIKGVGSSAIAHCLYPDMIKPGKYPRDLQLDYPDDLRRPFVNINSNKPRIQIVEKEIGISAITHEKEKPITLTKALEFKRVIKRMWRISSYSQIASQHEDVQIDRPDYDALAEPITETEKSSDGIIQDRFSFFKGAKAGTFLHDILEQSDFIKAMDETLVHDKCREYGYPIEWVRPVKNWLQDVINTELDGFSLSDIKNDRKLTEMEFYLTSDSLDADKLNDLLIQQGYLKSERKFNFNVLKGYLKGFIDLIFEYQGQYYIADYKSNYLGSEINDYTPAHCTSAMHQHHYHLQYLIYTLALHRYLQQRLDDYDYTQHMGGIYYLFLRGMSTSTPGTEKMGIYFDKPPAELIEQFDQLF